MCGIVFTNINIFKTHNYNAHNGPKPYQCLSCSMSFTTPCNLNDHTNAYHNINKKILKCNLCNKSYVRKACLNQHRLQHREVKLHKCRICSRAFTTLNEKRRHEITHNAVKKCTKSNKCDKSFVHKNGLQEHISMIHGTGEKIGCVFCEKGFKGQGDLNRHIRRHIYEKDQQCEICFKEFYSYHKKVMHLRVHTGERPFKCMECSESFTNGSNLKRHKRKHEIVKPFHCVFYEEGFTARDLLWSHILRKIKETWYSCKICKIECTTRGILRSHEIIHKAAEFSCEKCGIFFKRKSYIKLHMKWCDK